MAVVALAWVLFVGFMYLRDSWGADERSPVLVPQSTSTPGVQTANVTPRPTTIPTATTAPTPDALAGGCWSTVRLRGAQESNNDYYHQWSRPPSQIIDPARRYLAVLETTSGTLTVELLASGVPTTVNNFVCLARSGYYDGTSFYRITGTAIQGGDPTGTGTGGPGYQFADEPVVGAYTRGTLAMINDGPDTNGSRFFIFADDYAGVNRYTIFGRVVDGLDVIDEIVANPSNPPSIIRVTIHENDP